jgi:hypothetical protein
MHGIVHPFRPKYELLNVWESGADAIRVGGVVVVDVAIRVDIPEVSGVTSIRRTQPRQPPTEYNQISTTTLQITEPLLVRVQYALK